MLAQQALHTASISALTRYVGDQVVTRQLAEPSKVVREDLRRLMQWDEAEKRHIDVSPSGTQTSSMPETEIEYLRRRAAELEGENTHLRAAGAAAHARERHHRAIVESAVDFAIIAMDRDGRITDWNTGAERILGWSAEEMRGESADRFFTPEDRANDRTGTEMRGALETGRANDERWHLKKDGSRFWASGEMMPLRAEDGAHFGFLKILRDRTKQWRNEEDLRAMNDTLGQRVEARTLELQTSEEQLRQSQKMEAVGQLTGGLAHDFNNLLTVITGSLELLQTRLARGQVRDLDHYIIAAQGASKRAAALTHRLLAFSRRQMLDPKPTDVNRLIASMEALIHRTVGPEVAVEMVAAGGLWTTLIDQHQLENALLNLCINARDAMPDGGRLTVETGNKWLDERAARDRDLPPGQYVSLCVSDTGVGMTPEVIKRAFDPFFTTKPLGKGTGLGLSMVYGFVRQSGGQARVYSELGQGAMVCLYLPRLFGKEKGEDVPTKLAERSRAEQGETVLVVDDEATVRMLVTEVLEELGYTAIEAATGAAGLKVLQSDARIDLLVTDVGLPGGMNGRQLADAARVHRPELNVLFITGYAENAVVSHGHLEPGMHVLTKPFAIDALASRIKDLTAKT